MIPIMFGARILLGSLDLSSGSLIPCMIDHIIMDIGLFGISGPGSPASSRYDRLVIPWRGPGFRHRVRRCMRYATVTLLAIWRLRSLRQHV
jgi:hypothetical protein